MNILTFDIEEWYLEKAYHGARIEQYSKFECVLDSILENLDTLDTKGTFFCLGQMARLFPDIVTKIAKRGHEIGCHSDKHDWLTKVSKKQFVEDTKSAIHSLEDLIGQKVVSYRAPAFSIKEQNTWAFDVLAKFGIEFDASIFPANRNFGGFPSFKGVKPVLIKTDECVLKEFPICPAIVFNRRVMFSGGGYFRVFPLSVISSLAKRMDYVMFYFHIGDLIEKEKRLMSRIEYEEYFKENGSFKNRIQRYIKSNIGTRGALEKFHKLLLEHKFYSIQQANEIIDWNNQLVVEL